jgi:pimeloyl-ACP methyl ester carboxylesterase
MNRELRDVVGFSAAAIGAPTVVFHGDADDAVPVGVARWWARTLPRCDARIYSGEGHHLLDARGVEILREVAARV